MTSQVNHNNEVKVFFDNTEKYLQHSFGINIRIDIIKDILNGRLFDSLLDIGCGDGSISISLLNYVNKITLLDISLEMLTKAKQNIPVGSEFKINYVNGDILNLNSYESKFDLILGIGVLAHVYSVEEFVKIIDHVMLANGLLVLQFTNSANYLSRFNRKVRKISYPINLIEKENICKHMSLMNYELISEQQFGFTLPGFGFFSNSLLYKYESFIWRSSLLSKLGTDYILLFQKR